MINSTAGELELFKRQCARDLKVFECARLTPSSIH